MDPHDAWADDMVLPRARRYEEMVTEPVTR